MGTARASARPRAALGVAPPSTLLDEDITVWRPARSWPLGPLPTRAPAAGGRPLTSSETLNLRSRATTFCLKFCCCKRSGAQSEHAGLLPSDGGQGRLRQQRPVTSSRPHFSSGRRFQSVKPHLCSDLETGPQTGWWSGPSTGMERDLRLFQKPPCVRPHPASVDRGGGQSAGAHLLPVQPWSQGSALGTDPTGGAPAPSTKAGHQALGLRLTQMLSQQFRTHCGPDSWFTRCSGTSPWPPSLARWQALGQGVSTGASWAALHAGLAWGHSPAPGATAWPESAGTRGRHSGMGLRSARTSLLEEGPPALPSPRPPA